VLCNIQLPSKGSFPSSHELHLRKLHGYTLRQQYWTLFITNWCT